MALRVCDWSKYIVPRENITYFKGYDKDRLMKTKDKVSILSGEDCEEKRLCGKTATDFAFMNNLFQYKEKSIDGYHYSWYWIRSANDLEVDAISKNGLCNGAGCWRSDVGTSPSITLSFNKKIYSKDIKEIFGVSATDNSQNPYTVQLGYFPQTKVEKGLNRELETAYNGGKLQKGMECTGRLYTTNGVFNVRSFSPKQSGEFLYKGERYIRTIEHCRYLDKEYNDGTPFILNSDDRVMWIKVEPLTFKIANYNELENGADELVLDCDKIIMGGIPIFPDDGHNTPKDAQVWAGSLLRAYLNSTQIKDLNMPRDFQPIKNFDFRNSGFLNQALNMTSPPITKYKCGDYVDNICDHAFDGCVGLKKIIIPASIKQIGKMAFSGCVNAQLIFGKENEQIKFDRYALNGTNFKYIYVTKDGNNMIWAQNIDPSLEKICNRYDFDKKDLKKQISAVFKIDFFYDEKLQKFVENGGIYEKLE